MHLNNDCWLLVLFHFSDDARTLFKLLMVSRQFFELTVPILYSQPFALSQSQPIDSRRSLGVNRLSKLIELCKTSFPNNTLSYQQQYQLSIQWPISIHPEHQPATVNYAALAWRTGTNIWLKPSIWFFEQQDSISKISELRILVKELEKILPLVDRFCSLMILDPIVKKDFTMPKSLLPTAEDEQIVIRFVQAHKTAFPGLLQKIGSGFEWRNFEQFCRLQNALDPIQQLSLCLQPEDDLSLLPNETRQLWSIDTTLDGSTSTGIQGPLPDFLSTCRFLQYFKAMSVGPNTFKWAVKEREQFEKQSQSSSPSLSPPQPQPNNLVQLKEVDLKGDNQVLLDLLYAFQHSLEKIKFISSQNFRARLRWASYLPWLIDISIDNNTADLSCLASTCPNLKSLRISPAPLEPDHGTIWRAPSKLSTLIIKGISTIRLDLESLKDLICLEYLDLQCGKGEGVQRSIQTMEWLDLSDSIFPFLKTVILEGTPADAIRGQFLRVAPFLQEYSVEFPGHMWSINFRSFLSVPVEKNVEDGLFSGFPGQSTLPVKRGIVDENEKKESMGFQEQPQKTSAEGTGILPVEIKYSCLRSLTILNANIDNYNQGSFDDLFVLEEGPPDINQVETQYQDQEPASSFSTSPKLLRRFVHFPNLEHLTMDFRSCEMPDLDWIIVNLMKVNSLMTLTLSGTVYNTKSQSEEDHRRYGKRSIQLYQRKEGPLLKQIHDLEQVVRDERMHKACILRISLEDFGKYKFYWLPPPPPEGLQAVAVAEKETTMVDKNEKGSVTTSAVAVAVAVAVATTTSVATASTTAQTVSQGRLQTGEAGSAKMTKRISDWIKKKL